MDLFTWFLMNFSSVIFPALLAIVLAAAVILGLFLFRRKLAGLITGMARRVTSRFATAGPVIDACEKPLVLFIAVLGFYFGLSILAGEFVPDGLLVQTRSFLTRTLKIIFILLVIRSALSATNPLVTLLQEAKGKLVDQTIVQFISQIVKIIMISIGVVIIIDELGYNISGLVTGLGLGGLTIALAAQDTASNLFGGLIIITDKPFQAGDWIQTDKLEGTVMGIALRSTHIRTFKDAEIIVPNSTLSNTAIINWSRMTKRKVEMSLEVTGDTTRPQLEAVIAGIKGILAAHPDVDQEFFSVAFTEYSANGYTLSIAYFARLTPYPDCMRVREEVNLQIMSCLEEQDVHPAYPARTVYLDTSVLPEGKPSSK